MGNYPPKNILYLDHTAVLAGGEIALLNLVKNLDPSRYTPIVALLSDGPLAAALAAEKIQTHLLPASRAMLDARKDSLGAGSLLKFTALFSAATTIHRLTQLIRATRADLVHANSLKSDLLGGVAAHLADVPIIWHIRDRVADDYLSPAATKVVRTLANLLPTHVVANSRATLSTVHLKNPAAGSVIYSGLDLSACLSASSKPPATTSQNKAHGFIRGSSPPEPNPSPRIGIVGRLAHWKGQHVFLHAAALIRQQFPAANFQIVGGPLFGELDYEKHLHDLAASLGLTQSVDFTGHRDDVPALLSQMDIVIHASITPEPFGQVIVLAMAAAKPVIATAAGGVLEIITDNDTGLLVPMNDVAAIARAAERLLSNASFAEEVGQRGRERVKKQFTIQKTAALTMDLYDRILEQT